MNIDVQDGNDLVTLAANSSVGVFAKCQITDYSARGEELSHYNIVDFFVNTYEGDIGQRAEADGSSAAGDEHRRPGRPKNVRVRYQSLHPAYRKKERIVRTRGHNTLPNFVGSPFPR